MNIKIGKVELSLKNLFAILFGSAIFSFSINYFNIANGLAEGGFTGIALLLHALFAFPPGWFILISNIPLFIIGWRVLGIRSLAYTIFATVTVSFFLELFKGYGEPMKNDLFLASLYAGVGIGVGLGIIFRYGGTTGGVDIIARIVQKYWGISMGKTMFVFDLLVITLSLFTYLDRERAMYTLVCVYVGARIIDFVQEGSYAAKAVMIISDHARSISQAIMDEMSRGVTILEGKGAYTGSDREVLYCVVAKNEIQRIKSLVHSIDAHAFIVISDAHDVMGEGFTLDQNKKPIEK